MRIDSTIVGKGREARRGALPICQRGAYIWYSGWGDQVSGCRGAWNRVVRLWVRGQSAYVVVGNCWRFSECKCVIGLVGRLSSALVSHLALGGQFRYRGPRRDCGGWKCSDGFCGFIGPLLWETEIEVVRFEQAKQVLPDVYPNWTLGTSTSLCLLPWDSFSQI